MSLQMIDDRESSVEVLNQLLAAETQSLLARLPELWPSLTGTRSAAARIVERAADQSREHRAWLAERICALGGVVWPVTMDPATAAFHYCSLASLLPRIQQSLEALVDAYLKASARSRSLLPEASELVAQIARRHEANLQSLREVTAQPVGA